MNTEHTDHRPHAHEITPEQLELILRQAQAYRAQTMKRLTLAAVTGVAHGARALFTKRPVARPAS